MPSIHLPAAEALPAPFGRYQLEELLAEGGMGRVYRATLSGAEGFRKAVAVKVIKPLDKGGREQAEAAFVREARLCGLLAHPNVVDVYDFGVHEGHPFLAMELIQGWPLDEFLQLHGPPPATAALDLAIQVGEGLQHAHELKIDGEHVALVHRDLKPGNVLVTPQGGVKVLDFGLARTTAGVDARTASGQVRGTPAYMSPEQAEGNRALDPRSDLFAFGLLLHELATGRHPYPRSSFAAQLLALVRVEEVTAAPGFWERLDRNVPGLSPIVRRCLRREPGDRFDHVSKLIQTLRALSEQLPRGPSLRSWIDVLPRGGGAAQAEGVDNETFAFMSGPPEPQQLDRTATLEPEPPSAEPGHKLPASLDAFFGREAELTELADRVIHGQRLVTLLGAGGTGKTRLAEHFGTRMLSEFQGGVWFCDLSEASDLASLLGTVSRTLHVRPTREDPLVQLGHAIASRGRALILLDNFEQVVDLAPQTVGAWLQRAPKAVFIVTSRTRLALGGEQLLRLGPLPTDRAVELFFDRAQALQPELEATPPRREVVAKVVQRLDCLPLAIELAAARAAALSPEDILERLSERFKLLSRGRRDHGARQATLRGAIEWSWNLLAPWERLALAQASSFRGGFTLDAAEAVLDLSSIEAAPWPLDAVTALVEHSLVQVVGSASGRSRYRMYESVRDFAGEQLEVLGAAESTRRRHLGHYALLGSVEALTLGGPERREALYPEIDNLVRGVHGGTELGEAELAARCALAAVAVLEEVGPLEEGLDLLERVVDEALGGELRSRVLMARGHLKRVIGEASQAGRDLEEAIRGAREIGNRRLEGEGLRILGVFHWETGRGDLAREHYLESLAIARETRDRGAEGLALKNLGVFELESGRPERSSERLERALVIFEALGARSERAVVLKLLGNLCLNVGKFDLAREHYSQALVLLRELGSRWLEGTVLENLANLAMASGQLEVAQEHFDQALVIHRETGNRSTECNVQVNLGKLLFKAGDHQLAEEHLRRALKLSREVGARTREGIVLGNLGELLLGGGKLDSAEAHFRKGMELCARDLPFAAGVYLGSLAVIAAYRGDIAQARSLLDSAGPKLEGVRPIEHGRLLCKRVRVEALAGDPAAARVALSEAEAVAQALPSQPESELHEALVEAREALQALEPAAS